MLTRESSKPWQSGLGAADKQRSWEALRFHGPSGGDAYLAPGRDECGGENVGGADKGPRYLMGGGRRDAKEPAAGGTQKMAEHRRTIEARQAAPVDRPICGHERGL